MHLSILTPGRIKKPYIKEGCDDYVGRLKRYTRLEMIEVREEPAVRGIDAQIVKRREGERLLARVPEGALIVALDERGEAWSSVALSEFLVTHRDRGLKELAFIIGGPLGLSPEVLERAPRRLSLSAMTLPHELVRLMLLEQCYRAFTILHGEPYHNP